VYRLCVNVYWLLLPGGYTTAVNKNIYHILYHISSIPINWPHDSSPPHSIRFFISVLILSYNLGPGIKKPQFPSGSMITFFCLSCHFYLCYRHTHFIHSSSDRSSHIWCTVQIKMIPITQSFPTSCFFILLLCKLSPQLPVIISGSGSVILPPTFIKSLTV
jgi:hypothetical protein